MKIDTTILHNFSKDKYLAYIRSLSSARREKIHTYGSLILTLTAILFFGIFAITPTLSTIFELRKSLEDSKYLDTQLQIKINHLTKLQDSYPTVSKDLPIIYAGIPQTPATTKLTGQIRQLATDSHVTLRSINTQSVYIAKAQETKKTLTPFIINITARGSNEDLLKFAALLTGFERILRVNFITVTAPLEKNVTYHQLAIQLTAYFRP